MLSFNTCLSPESKLQSIPFPSITISDVIPGPGLLFVHTPHGLCLVHPGNLQPVIVEGLEGVASPDPADLNPHIQFKGDNPIFQVVKVYGIERHCTEEVAAAHHTEHSQPDEQEEGGVETKPQQGGVLGERNRVTTEDEAKSTTEAENAEDGKSKEAGDFGSCCVAFTVNNRLLVLAVSHRYVCLCCLHIITPNHDGHLVHNQDRNCKGHT